LNAGRAVHRPSERMESDLSFDTDSTPRHGPLIVLRNSFELLFRVLGPSTDRISIKGVPEVLKRF
jgi:hypothetical protein